MTLFLYLNGHLQSSELFGQPKWTDPSMLFACNFRTVVRERQQTAMIVSELQIPIKQCFELLTARAETFLEKILTKVLLDLYQCTREVGTNKGPRNTD